MNRLTRGEIKLKSKWDLKSVLNFKVDIYDFKLLSHLMIKIDLFVILQAKIVVLLKYLSFSFYKKFPEKFYKYTLQPTQIR